MCLSGVLDPLLPSFAHSESPYSEHGALEEVENEGGTETHTSEDGEFPHFHVQIRFRKTNDSAPRSVSSSGRPPKRRLNTVQLIPLNLSQPVSGGGGGVKPGLLRLIPLFTALKTR